MDHAFYPFVDNMSEDASRGDEKSQESKQKETTAQGELGAVRYPARIAIYDDAAAAPRVVVIEPTDIRSYLEEITATVNRLAHEQGSQIPFTVIREIVENFIHAYFIAPTITILDGGNTLRFSDQGPGIQEKDLAMEYGTTSATEEMKHYIRGVGSGLPYVQQYMTDKGGSLTIEDNISGGTVVTISTRPKEDAERCAAPGKPGGTTQQVPQSQMPQAYGQTPYPTQPMPGAYQQPFIPGYQQYYQPVPSQIPQGFYPQQGYQQPAYQQQTPAQALAPARASEQPAPAWTAELGRINLSDRSQTILEYLSAHEMVGPTELVRTYGKSAPTWSRELASLVQMGVLKKIGQKYYLTQLGQNFV
ncbi:Histidine kinase-, DNA gyrase B-, and HSP90-like ATPase [Olsenella sp. KH3B4]|uniref:ATP-binding protein n=1 Tax=Olsenella sp. KH3B4 TaxID=1855394 RepID=UPI0008CCB190|nr:ATP-binding protein [Olsenella sp. KH3B4]SET13310.1 Histidine kinase-, DNA gyrase B-, and HSP90-like ATPase [Olsenella sp. KH3B4]